MKAVSEVQSGCPIVSKCDCGSAEDFKNTAVTFLSLSETWGVRGSFSFNFNINLETLLFCYNL